MRKHTNLKGTLCVLALCAMFAGCDDSSNGSLCEMSGGTMKDDLCYCGSSPNPCDPGAVQYGG